MSVRTVSSRWALAGLCLLATTCAPAAPNAPSGAPASAPAPSSSGPVVSAASPDPAEVQQQLRRYFFDAARGGRRDMLEAFVSARYDLNVRDEQGYTALILAAYHGHRDMVEQLLRAGADPCAQDRRGNTALMGAIFKGELAIARRLVQADCAPDQRNNAGQTAAMYAALFQRAELLQALAAKGADLAAHDARGNSVSQLQRGAFAPAPAR